MLGEPLARGDGLAGACGSLRAARLLLLGSLLAGFLCGNLQAAGESKDREASHTLGVPDARGVLYGVTSERTLAVALEVDREQVRLLSYTLKNRPFVQPLNEESAEPTEGGPPTLELALLKASSRRYVRRMDLPGICLEHAGDEPPHILGDTIRVHRDSIVVEFPEAEGSDRIEVAAIEGTPGKESRRILGAMRLDSLHFTEAGGSARYGDLLFASEEDKGASPQPETLGTVIWPENIGDPDIYTVFGNAAEVNRRINVTIVPDGYTYAQKSLMVSHATSMVQKFRATTPYREHDNLINYILVYAYSVESGTDQCDCSIVANTAMGSGFPNAGAPCGDSANRCLYYGYGCDTDVSTHIAAAELRAPASDAKVVMVNTSRYGGCGGARAVYSAANSSATDIATHELGHSLAGLADEYVSSAGCGGQVGNINTSTNATMGAWPEWIADLGPPWEGAQYYAQCIYRPMFDCLMRSLGAPFCSVCNQRWATSLFGHFRVAPTAPIESASPDTPVVALIGTLKDFSVTPRFAIGPGVSNSFTWKLQGPGFPTPTVVATGAASYSRSFAVTGSFTLTCEVVADTNYVKPVKNAGNADLATWSIEAVEDVDQDGSYSNVDCNDHNAAIHPGANEACNGVDEDCDGMVDEGFDQDADGLTSCGGDCDDTRASVRPGAAQVCDGLNNDCLWPGWPSLAGTNERDDDLDLYSECQGDCDDSKASVRPGGAQVCDGLNNDCLSPGWPSLAGTNDSDDDLDSLSECQGDCDDATAETHPGAPEFNDGKDNQCQGETGYSLIDEITGAAGFNNPGDATQLCWPQQQGAGLYEVIRASGAAFAGGCTSSYAAASCWQDSGTPGIGQVSYYLVRAAGPHVGSWGARSSGVERTGLCAGESQCSDAVDNDSDGRIDCEDPDCVSQSTCQPAVFGFVDTLGNDVGEAALLDYFSALAPDPSSYLFYSLEGPSSGAFSACVQRADFYRDSYVAWSVTGGAAASGAWSKWYRSGSGAWVGPVTTAYDNSFGPACVEDYSWCLEYDLGGRALVLLPGRNDECEGADLAEGCGSGNWRFTLRVARSRLAACGF